MGARCQFGSNRGKWDYAAVAAVSGDLVVIAEIRVGGRGREELPQKGTRSPRLHRLHPFLTYALFRKVAAGDPQVHVALFCTIFEAKQNGAVERGIELGAMVQLLIYVSFRWNLRWVGNCPHGKDGRLRCLLGRASYF